MQFFIAFVLILFLCIAVSGDNWLFALIWTVVIFALCGLGYVIISPFLEKRKFERKQAAKKYKSTSSAAGKRRNVVDSVASNIKTHEKYAKTKRETIEEAIDSARSDLLEMYPWQKACIISFTKFFRRFCFTELPERGSTDYVFLFGPEEAEKYNCILMCGNACRGAFKAAGYYGATVGLISIIDCSEYSDQNSSDAFWGHLIDRIEGEQRFIILKDFEKLSSGSCEIIKKVLTQGIRSKNGNTGYLQKNLDGCVNETNALEDCVFFSRKIFFFTSCANSDSIAKKFGNDLDCPSSNIVYASVPSSDDRVLIVRNAIDELRGRANKEFDLKISCTSSVESLLARFTDGKGQDSISNFVNETIWRPLAGLVSDLSLDSSLSYGISAENEKLYISDTSKAANAMRFRLIDLTEKDFLEDAAEVHHPPLDLENELSDIVGIQEVKDFVRLLNSRIKIDAERQKRNLPLDETQSLHMIFSGNPGTGKTTMARIIARMLYGLGVIKSSKLTEVSRADLVAGYAGQTAIKTNNVIDVALNGVLFIDEAYSLIQSEDDSFGHEAVDVLVKRMDDDRDKLVVILAGYTTNMRAFLDSNPGLRSRFPQRVEFPDYSLDDLKTIIKRMYESRKMQMSSEAEEKLDSVLLKAMKESDDFGNARYVRNVYERSLLLQSARLSKKENISDDELLTIESADIVYV